MIEITDKRGHAQSVALVDEQRHRDHFVDATDMVGRQCQEINAMKPAHLSEDSDCDG